MDVAGFFIGLILTLFVFSYVWKDNPLYRLAVHLLVGVSAAYAAVLIVQQLFLPYYQALRADPANLELISGLVPIVLGLLLVLKRLPRLAWLGTGTMALLMGVGAAVALLGALTGTLWPQVTAVVSDNLILNLLVALLTIATLVTFQFSGRRPGPADSAGEWVRPIWQRGLAQVGQAVLMITFGALFAAVFNTSLVLLIDRISFFLNQFTQLLS
ncbi:MAG: hypothetical protein KC425_02325 [Anaerolineales bacterium]|nr:hypothetical protein [Anaerolineales bacterium]